MTKKAKNVRFRPDQIAALEKMETTEMDFSKLVRLAVDRWLAEARKVKPSESHRTYHGVATPADMRRMKKGQQTRIEKRRLPRRRLDRPQAGSAHA